MTKLAILALLMAWTLTINAQRQVLTVNRESNYELFFISGDPEIQSNWNREQPIKFLDYLDSAASFSVTDQDAISQLSSK